MKGSGFLCVCDLLLVVFGKLTLEPQGKQQRRDTSRSTADERRQLQRRGDRVQRRRKVLDDVQVHVWRGLGWFSVRGALERRKF